MFIFMTIYTCTCIMCWKEWRKHEVWNFPFKNSSLQFLLLQNVCEYHVWIINYIWLMQNSVAGGVVLNSSTLAIWIVYFTVHNIVIFIFIFLWQSCYKVCKFTVATWHSVNVLEIYKKWEHICNCFWQSMHM